MTLESDLEHVKNELNWHMNKLNELLGENEDAVYYYKSLPSLTGAVVDISHAVDKIDKLLEELKNGKNNRG